MLSNCIAFLVVLLAAGTDVTRGKVYNAITYPAVVIGLGLGLVSGSPAFLKSLVGLVASFGLYFVLHKLGGLGAGDVKLMAAVGALKGFTFVIFSTFYIFCFGSAIGLLILAWRGQLGVSLKWVFSMIASGVVPGIPRTKAKGTFMPFAPAIFLGVSYCIYLEASRGPLILQWLI